MKVRIIEFEATADEMRANNSIGQNLVEILNDALSPISYEKDETEEEDKA